MVHRIRKDGITVESSVLPDNRVSVTKSARGKSFLPGSEAWHKLLGSKAELAKPDAIHSSCIVAQNRSNSEEGENSRKPVQ